MSRPSLDRLERVLGTTTDAIERERHDQRLLDLLEDNKARPEVNWDAHTPAPDPGRYEDYPDLQSFINACTSQADHSPVSEKDTER